MIKRPQVWIPALMRCCILDKVTISSLLCSDLTQEKVQINLLTGMLSINSDSKNIESWTFFNTPGRQQSKKLSTIHERGSKIDRNSVFDCHLSPVWWQMAIKNTVPINFWSTFLNSIGIFDCHLPGVFKEESYLLD